VIVALDETSKATHPVFTAPDAIVNPGLNAGQFCKFALEYEYDEPCESSIDVSPAKSSWNAPAPPTAI